MTFRKQDRSSTEEHLRLHLRHVRLDLEREFVFNRKVKAIQALVFVRGILSRGSLKTVSLVQLSWFRNYSSKTGRLEKPQGSVSQDLFQVSSSFFET